MRMRSLQKHPSVALTLQCSLGWWVLPSLWRLKGNLSACWPCPWSFEHQLWVTLSGTWISAARRCPGHWVPSKQHHPRALRLCPCNPGKAHCFAQCCSLSPSYGFSFSYMCGQPCLVAQTVKNLPAMQETQVRSLDPGEDPLEKEMAMHSSIVAWRNPWIEEPGRLQSVGLQTVRHDGATNTFTSHRCRWFF